jgi:hypothetical protein
VTTIYHVGVSGGKDSQAEQDVDVCPTTMASCE